MYVTIILIFDNLLSYRFSQAKKCTNGGRALMQLDYQQFLSKVERLTDVQPVPGKEQVENYIKAYYMLETNLEQWIRSHRVSICLKCNHWNSSCVITFNHIIIFLSYSISYCHLN